MKKAIEPTESPPVKLLIRKGYPCAKQQGNNFYTPGGVKGASDGQFPRPAGSPPIRTHWDWEGVGPSRTNNMYQPAGETLTFGGAVIVQSLPVHVT